MTLTVALAILGGLVLVAVLAHGLWSARRARPLRIDGAAGSGDVRVEPALAPSPSADGGRQASRRPLPRLDALIDAIVPLALEQPVAGELALAHLPATRRAGSKPFLVEGLDAESGAWEAPQAGRRYREFQAGVQMTNRGGAINEIEYSEFVQKVQSFADAIGAAAEPPDMLDVVARARELDAFANGHDAQLAVRLEANGAAWSLGFLAQAASRRGFVAGALPGRMALPQADDDTAPPVLSLSFDPQAALADDPARATLASATLALDVPQTASEADPFGQWRDAALALAAELDARLVDDAGQAIDAQGFAAIGAELRQRYAALESRDLAAGSAAARRLFA